MNSISVKLFLALFGLTSLVLLAGLGLARWSLNYGFNDYLNSIQEQRLEVIADQLVIHYNNNGGQWNYATQNVFRSLLDPRASEILRGVSLYESQEDALQVLLNQSLEEDLAQLAFLDQIITPSGPNDLPPPPMGMGMGPGPMGPGPVTQAESNLRESAASSALQNDNLSPVDGQTIPLQLANGPPDQPPPRGARITPTMLYDANGNQLANVGNSIADVNAMVKPIKVDDVIVGELRAFALPEFNSPNENTFFAQQQLAGVTIVFGSLLLTAIASWFLSRMMLAPVVRIKKGIAELASGDYQLSLDIDRKDELGLLMTDVNKLGSRLEKNRLSRRNFIADISHELRTPVTILGGEIEALKDGVRELNMDSVESLDHETNRLKHLIEDLYQLSLSDIGGLRYEFTKLDVVEVLKSTIDQQKIRIDNIGLELEFSANSSYVILADKQRLLQLFTNLLNNSINYTDKPGRIRVTVQQNNSHVVVLFEDSAPGIDHEDMGIMFEPLFRAEESRNRTAGGAGLGLTICRNIALAHDATIEASPSDLGGVLFRVLFPIIRR